MAGRAEPAPKGPDFTLEEAAASCRGDLFTPSTPLLVLGVDEAGRGPWAGPVTAAAAWINPAALADLPSGLDDSKKLSRRQRQALFQALTDLPAPSFCFAAVSVTAEVIDDIGILPATFRAMDQAAVQVLDQMTGQKMAQMMTGQMMTGGVSPEDRVHLLVDGHLAPPFDRLRRRQHPPLAIDPVIKGDQRSLSIAAASIMAKETRDLEMIELDKLHPGYDWASNMGYGTASHQQGLATQGPTQHHRFSYSPVAKAAAKFGTTR